MLWVTYIAVLCFLLATGIFVATLFVWLKERRRKRMLREEGVFDPAKPMIDAEARPTENARSSNHSQMVRYRQPMGDRLFWTLAAAGGAVVLTIWIAATLP